MIGVGKIHLKRWMKKHYRSFDSAIAEFISDWIALAGIDWEEILLEMEMGGKIHVVKPPETHVNAENVKLRQTTLLSFFGRRKEGKHER